MKKKSPIETLAHRAGGQRYTPLSAVFSNLQTLPSKLLCGLGLAFAVGAPAAAHATDFADSPYLFGNWGGERDSLADRGAQFDFSFTNELSHNFSGGDDRLTRAASQLAANITLDLNRLWGIRHTTFSMIVTDRFGRSVDPDANIGSTQQSQEVYGRGQTVWLTKLTLDRAFFDGRLDVTVGRDSEGNHYDVAPCNFQNLALCGPQGPNLYGNYWMSYPGSVWMANALVHTTASTFVQFGAYQQNPTYYDNNWEQDNAWKPTNPRGTDGVVLPLEFGWTPTFGGRKGSYRIGAMLNTGGMPDLLLDVDGNQRALTGLAARRSGTSFNAWIAISQQLTGESGGEGLTVGVRGVMGDRATSELDRQMTVSFEYQNPLHRTGDRIGLGFAATHINSRYAMYQAEYNAANPDDTSQLGHGYEYVSELYYDLQVIRSVSLQPSLQYTMHPGGSTQNANALFVGLRTSVSF
ncbi:carbohydrate porin [Paraburkholderia sp. Ac-20347]|uniref:carbohydrate porin n=1 Tax=Paraburkholderia sp. Ac-20347 TaxID=2703892 RepID=UPI0019826CE1|nr:porin [Paraburkholderia sp. Ac-20347]